MKKILIVVGIFLFIFSLGIIFIRFYFLLVLVKKESLKIDCPLKIEKRVVRGNSLEPILKPGQEVKILQGYYECYPILRNDVVAFHHPAFEEPLIKIVKGIPGDKFELEKINGNWNILINNEILKNSQSQDYVLDENTYRILFLYETDYKGIIPEGAYLILGNQSCGTLDSTRFGLIHTSDILGKVEY